MSNSTAKKEEIILGACDLYAMAFNGGEIPEDSVIETEENKFCETKGGTSIEYKVTTYKVESDNGTVKRIYATKDEANLKTGIINVLNEKVLKILNSVGTTDTSTPGVVKAKIGGIKHFSGKAYIIRAVHKDDISGETRITIVGLNSNGLAFAFDPSKETIVDAVFECEPCDGEGTLIIYEHKTAEYLKKSAEPQG